MDWKTDKFPCKNESVTLAGNHTDYYPLYRKILIITLFFFIFFSIGETVYGADAWTSTSDQFKVFIQDIWSIGKYICYVIALVIFAFGGYQWGRNHNMILGIEMIVVGVFFCAIPWFVSLFSSSSASSDPFK